MGELQGRYFLLRVTDLAFMIFLRAALAWDHGGILGVDSCLLLLRWQDMEYDDHFIFIDPDVRSFV